MKQKIIVLIILVVGFSIAGYFLVKRSRTPIHIDYGQVPVSPPRTGSTADLFSQARDSQRMSDLGTLKAAIALYLTTVEHPKFCADKNKVYRSDVGTMAVDGTGWLPVDLNKTTGGSPLPILPKDPINQGVLIYTYACDQNTLKFELDGVIESQRYVSGGKDDVTSTDGGDNANLYETGTSLTLLH